MGKTLTKRYLLYILRWQCSTPVLALCLQYLHLGVFWNTVIANLLGALIFFWVDGYIFKKKNKNDLWEVSNVPCFDCGAITRTYRLVSSGKYDRTEDPDPEFRCEPCSIKKKLEMKA